MRVILLFIFCYLPVMAIDRLPSPKNFSCLLSRHLVRCDIDKSNVLILKLFKFENDTFTPQKELRIPNSSQPLKALISIDGKTVVLVYGFTQRMEKASLVEVYNFNKGALVKAVSASDVFNKSNLPVHLKRWSNNKWYEYVKFGASQNRVMVLADKKSGCYFDIYIDTGKVEFEQLHNDIK